MTIPIIYLHTQLSFVFRDDLVAFLLPRHIFSWKRKAEVLPEALLEIFVQIFVQHLICKYKEISCGRNPKDVKRRSVYLQESYHLPGVGSEECT